VELPTSVDEPRSPGSRSRTWRSRARSPEAASPARS
jgi:hypothetical protein